jgi:hypothetical protein
MVEMNLGGHNKYPSGEDISYVFSRLGFDLTDAERFTGLPTNDSQLFALSRNPSEFQVEDTKLAERIRLCEEILIILDINLRGEDRVNAWLKAANENFARQKPIDLIRTGDVREIRKVRSLLEPR